MNGITDPTLAPAKFVVNGNEIKLSDFEQCQQYFQTVIFAAKTETPTDNQRKVAAVQTKKGK